MYKACNPVLSTNDPSVVKISAHTKHTLVCDVLLEAERSMCTYQCMYKWKYWECACANNLGALTLNQCPQFISVHKLLFLQTKCYFSFVIMDKICTNCVWTILWNFPNWIHIVMFYEVWQNYFQTLFSFSNIRKFGKILSRLMLAVFFI